MSVSSYAPEFLELFKTAAQQELTIPLGNTKRATRLRFRLNMLRRAMRIEHHSLTTIANSVQFSITSEGHLHCSPADASFLDDLKGVGVEVQVPTTPTLTPTPFRSDAEEVIKKFLRTSDSGEGEE